MTLYNFFSNGEIYYLSENTAYPKVSMSTDKCMLQSIYVHITEIGSNNREFNSYHRSINSVR